MTILSVLYFYHKNKAYWQMRRDSSKIIIYKMYLYIIFTLKMKM